MPGDLWTFLAAVVSQWQALVTGSLLTALLFVLERWRPVSKRTILIVFVGVYLGIATFLAWRDERQRFKELEVKTTDAQPLSLDQEQRMLAVLREGKGSSVGFAVLSSDQKGREFAQRLQSTFSKAGWSLGGGGGSSSGSGRSLRILADDPNTKAVSLIMTAFNEAGLRYRVFRVCQNTPAAIEIGEAEVEKAMRE
jgi:uncharacterized membrane protein YgcG